MFDCHYDLLTHILMKKNDTYFLKEYCRKVYTANNITGGIFNLFYMSTQEMKEEIGIEENQINVIENLKEAKEYIEFNHIIPDNIQYIFGIEGLDYLEKIEDIDVLYELGLRSTNPVWNHPNKFGGGIKADKNYGLTQLGEKLIRKLVSKKIAIDLSHTNEKTFFDIIDVCKSLRNEGLSPIVFASHSNAKALCNVPRNLSDEQLLAIRDLDGLIGVVSIKRFCINTKDVCDSKINYEQKYIDHINYIRNLLGGIENIAVATDDMSYYDIEPEYYQNANVFPFFTIQENLIKALVRNHYTEMEINQILQENSKNKILNIINSKS